MAANAMYHSLELRNSMTTIQDENAKSLRTMVDLGCDFYVNAVVCAATTA